MAFLVGRLNTGAAKVTDFRPLYSKRKKACGREGLFLLPRVSCDLPKMNFLLLRGHQSMAYSSCFNAMRRPLQQWARRNVDGFARRQYSTTGEVPLFFFDFLFCCSRLLMVVACGGGHKGTPAKECHFVISGPNSCTRHYNAKKKLASSHRLSNPLCVAPFACMSRNFARSQTA